MNDEAPFFERVLRVTHAHIAHRAHPPTRFEPWTNRWPSSEAYRQYVGYAIVDTETNGTVYCYLVPDFESSTPRLNIHYGPAGDPALDPVVSTLEVNWDV